MPRQWSRTPATGPNSNEPNLYELSYNVGQSGGKLPECFPGIEVEVPPEAEEGYREGLFERAIQLPSLHHGGR